MKPACGSPKKIGPPLELELLFGESGEEGDAEDGDGVAEEGGKVSHERVRRQDWRIMENDAEDSGSWVEV